VGRPDTHAGNPKPTLHPEKLVSQRSALPPQTLHEQTAMQNTHTRTHTHTHTHTQHTHRTCARRLGVVHRHPSAPPLGRPHPHHPRRIKHRWQPLITKPHPRHPGAPAQRQGPRAQQRLPRRIEQRVPQALGAGVGALPAGGGRLGDE